MHVFRSDSLDLAYVDLPPTGADRGEPIVLVHGFASNHMVNWVNTSWVRTLTHDGRRVIALDNRGHGQSDRAYNPADYDARIMAEDVRRLMDHLGIQQADVMGYSMGARITAFFALAHPDRARSALLGGLGIKLVDGVGLPLGIADAMEVASADELTDPMQRMFRLFAEQTKSDLKAMAACIRGSRQTMTEAEVRQIGVPTLVSVGTADTVAGPAAPLAQLLPHGEVLDIPAATTTLRSGTGRTSKACWTFWRAAPEPSIATSMDSHALPKIPTHPASFTGKDGNRLVGTVFGEAGRARSAPARRRPDRPCLASRRAGTGPRRLARLGARPARPWPQRLGGVWRLSLR